MSMKWWNKNDSRFHLISTPNRVLQEMTVYPYKLDARVFTYTMSTVDLDMDSASEVWGRTTPEHVFQISPSETSNYKIP